MEFSLNRIQQRLHPPGSAAEVLGTICRLFLTAGLMPRKKDSAAGAYGLQCRAAGASYPVEIRVPVPQDPRSAEPAVQLESLHGNASLLTGRSFSFSFAKSKRLPEGNLYLNS
jgi:hypothetical protein